MRRPADPETGVLPLGDFELELGGSIPDAKLVYVTHGTLNAARDNAILYPHFYSGSPASVASTIAPGRALDPERWFVVCPGQLGGGLSSSPSNAEPPLDGPRFPRVTIGDDVTAQHRLVTERFGIERLELVLGASMGAQQAYEWAVRHPELVRRLAAIAGTARTTPWNALAVELAEDALRADGARLHAHAWVQVALSHELWRTEGWRELGFTSVGDLVQRLFEDDYAALDPHDLACQCWKWRHADVSRHTDGDLAAALGRIRARTAVIAYSHDLLFPVSDCDTERLLVPGAALRVIESLWGHWAWESTPSFGAQLDRHLRELLEQPA